VDVFRLVYNKVFIVLCKNKFAFAQIHYNNNNNNNNNIYSLKTINKIKTRKQYEYYYGVYHQQATCQCHLPEPSQKGVSSGKGCTSSQRRQPGYAAYTKFHMERLQIASIQCCGTFKTQRVFINHLSRKKRSGRRHYF
jgi:hypothetical protein